MTATLTIQNLDSKELLAKLSDREQNLQNAAKAATVAADERNEVVLELKRRGFRNNQIATELGISPTRVGQLVARAETREKEVAA